MSKPKKIRITKKMLVGNRLFYCDDASGQRWISNGYWVIALSRLTDGSLKEYGALDNRIETVPPQWWRRLRPRDDDTPFIRTGLTVQLPNRLGNGIVYYSYASGELVVVQPAFASLLSDTMLGVHDGDRLIDPTATVIVMPCYVGTQDERRELVGRILRGARCDCD